MELQDVFRSERLRFTAFQDADAEIISQWTENEHYARMIETDPMRPESASEIQAVLTEKNSRTNFLFALRPHNHHRLVGMVGIGNIKWNHRDGWLVIGFGEPEDWGKGYGREAMELMMRYAFHELNLLRISLSVFEYNQRALRLYDSLGFTREGVMRKAAYRDGRPYDIAVFSMLREEWVKRERQQREAQSSTGQDAS